MRKHLETLMPDRDAEGLPKSWEEVVQALDSNTCNSIFKNLAKIASERMQASNDRAESVSFFYETVISLSEAGKDVDRLAELSKQMEHLFQGQILMTNRRPHVS